LAARVGTSAPPLRLTTPQGSMMTPSSSTRPISAVQQISVGIVSAAVRLQFPNKSLFFLGFLALPGIAIHGTKSFFSSNGRAATSSNSEHIAVGCVALLWIASACAGVWWLEHRSPLVRRFRFKRYSHSSSSATNHSEISRRSVAFLAPVGFWYTRALRAMYGKLRGAVREGKERTALLTTWMGLATAVISGMILPNSWCVGVWLLLAIINLCALTATVALWPGRSDCSNVLQSVGYLLAFSLQVLSGVWQLDLMSTEEYARYLQVLIISASVLSCVKTAHSCFVFVWERQKRDIHSHLEQENNSNNNNGAAVEKGKMQDVLRRSRRSLQLGDMAYDLHGSPHGQILLHEHWGKDVPSPDCLIDIQCRRLARLVVLACTRVDPSKQGIVPQQIEVKTAAAAATK
jgi:hypothetical protein